MKKLIVTGIVATVVAALVSVSIAHGEELQIKSEFKEPTRTEQTASTGEIQPILGEAQPLSEMCKICPNPNLECIPSCAREVVGRPIAITSSADLGNGCSIQFQMNTRRARLIPFVAPNQSEDSARTLCDRLSHALVNNLYVKAEIAPISTGVAYLYSFTLFYAPLPASVESMEQLMDVLIDLTVNELY